VIGAIAQAAIFIECLRQTAAARLDRKSASMDA
jgi:hypothetical protein